MNVTLLANFPLMPWREFLIFRRHTHTLALALISLLLTGCQVVHFGIPKGAVVGQFDAYDYSPSIIESDGLQKFWWCGLHANPNDSSQVTDAILYATIDLSTGVKSNPVAVLGETPGAWDSVFTCNPKVVQGEFVNPLGNGETYTYAMYYVGTANGANNSIGVAFSKDGVAWEKYPTPVIPFTSTVGYGPAQPVPYNSDQKSSVWLFYEDSTPPTNHHTQAVSTDGIHFTTVGILTTNGMDPLNPGASWGDMALDSKTGYWYATFNLSSRPKSTTSGRWELGQYGIQLYRIPRNALLTGTTPWERLKTIDTNLTGYEANFLAGILRDRYGNINVGPYPTVQLYPSISNPQAPWNASTSAAAASADVTTWDIGSATWSSSDSALLALNRYFNGTTYEVTTGWVDPAGKFLQQASLGHLYETSQHGASLPLYGCKAGSTDYFVSPDLGCEGQRILGLQGYGYSQPVSALKLTAIYRCSTGTDHFVSTDSNCEGQTTQMLLGYVLP